MVVYNYKFYEMDAAMDVDVADLGEGTSAATEKGKKRFEVKKVFKKLGFHNIM